MAQKELKNSKNMTKLNLDSITETQKKLYFHNDRLINMYENVKAFSNAQIIYSELEKRLEREQFRFVNSRGEGRCKILVTDVKFEERFMFLY